jgi:hypothetical protein
MTQQINDGRYIGRFTGEVSVYENQKGTLVAAFPIEVEGQVRTWFATLVQQDGTVNTRRVGDLKTMLGWDGQIESIEGLTFAGAECEVTIANEAGQDGTVYSNIKYADPVGGGGAKIPEAMDRRTLVAKYAAKFRAVAGGAPAKPAAPKATPPPAKPPVGGPPVAKPPAPRVATANMEECWAALAAASEGQDRQAVEANWFAILDEVATGKQSPDLTPEEWGAVKARIAKMVEARADGIPY